MQISLSELFGVVIESLDPAAFVSKYLRENRLLHEEGPAEKVTLLALGKAACAMATGAREVLGDRINCEVVVAQDLPPGAPTHWMKSDHPVPTERSAAAARALLHAAANAQGPVLALISGGGSALATLPADGVSLEAKAALLGAVYAEGSDISELNAVRKHLSRIKGGRLAAASAYPVTTLVLSDVLGDCLSTVASGPTCPDSSSYSEALAIVQRLCPQRAGGEALTHLVDGTHGLHEESPKLGRPGDTAVLLAGMSSLVDHAVVEAESRGAQVYRISEPLVGSVESVCELLCNAILDTQHDEHGLWIGGGEATISLPSNPGRGGRAQHLALLLAERISGRRGVEILVAGSDGIDGNSDAAGAFVDGATWEDLLRAKLCPRKALDSCDSARVLASIGAQLVTGPTGVNHADLVLIQIS
ncbi:MAG: DUF4147 domain-containing protein [Myxococcales bacterium]|nr:DUF4147 domain-containing protein [Myxococcales bacterium]